MIRTMDKCKLSDRRQRSQRKQETIKVSTMHSRARARGDDQ